MTKNFCSENFPLWVVTSYFNPLKSARRYENFQIFRQLLNAPLLVVELERNGNFQLTQEDGNVVLQLTGEDRMWQKERLLNIGIEHLPDHVEYVAWVDCDVIFEDRDWATQTLDLHKTGYTLLQLFELVWHLPQSADLDLLDRNLLRDHPPVLTEVSATTQINHPNGIANLRNTARRGEPSKGDATIFSWGIAWSCHREFLSNQLYDRNIVGGGDYILFAGATGDYETVKKFQSHSKRHEADARSWLNLCGSAGMFKRVGFVEQTVFHLWHGHLADRQYADRHKILVSHDYDPNVDIHLSETGTWAWVVPDSSLARDVTDYFRLRREDG